MIRKIWSKRHNCHLWQYDVRINKVRYRDSFPKRDDAVTALAALHSQAKLEKYGLAPRRAIPVTLSELIDARIRGSDSPTKRRAVVVLRRFAELVGPKLTVDHIAKRHLAAYVDERLRLGRLPQTVARELNDICACLAAASDLFSSLEEYIPPRRPKFKVARFSRERTITLNEASRLVKDLMRPREAREAPASYRFRLDSADFLLIALQTGARHGEIQRLKVSDVNFEWRTLRLPGKKTEKSLRVIPMPDALVALLRRRIKALKSPWLFPSSRDPSQAVVNFTLDAIRRAAERCGIPFGRGVAGGMVLHDARHTAVTAMLLGGNDHTTVRSITGHSSSGMLMRYSHTTAEAQRRAVASLNQFDGEILSADVPQVPVLPLMPRTAQGGKRKKR